MMTCKQIADYFLTLFDNDEDGELLSNLKLQKLVYYAQGTYLAKYDELLFEDAIEAWAYGYVIPSLYQEFKKHGASALPAPDNFEYSNYPKEMQDVLDEVYLNYGQYSAWRLSQLNHEESLWKEYKDGKNDSVIPVEEIKSFFKKKHGF